MAVQRELQRRRAASNVFAGRHGFITPRDLFRQVATESRAHAGCNRPWLAVNLCRLALCRWAGRGAVGYQLLAEDGFAVLGERLRSAEERGVVQEVLQKVLGAKVGWSMRHGPPPATDPGCSSGIL